MSFSSSDFLKTRFRRSLDIDHLQSTLNEDLYLLLSAIDERKTMEQIASELNMDLDTMRVLTSRLLDQELIKPTELNQLFLDRNFVKMLQLNLWYILGNKNMAYSIVDSAIKEIGLNPDEIPATQALEIVAKVSTKIDPELSKRLYKYMELIIPLRAKRLKGAQPIEQAKSSGSAEISRGETRLIIDAIIAKRSLGNPDIARSIKTKFMLKGIDPDSYLYDTPDNPLILGKLRILAKKVGVDIEKDSLQAEDEAVSTGQIRHLLDAIIQTRSKGNSSLIKATKTKFMLKGIDINVYSAHTPDDPAVLMRIKKIASSIGVFY